MTWNSLTATRKYCGVRLAEGNILAGACYNSTSDMQEEKANIHSNITKACSRMSNKEIMLCGDFNHNTINWNELEATAERSDGHF